MSSSVRRCPMRFKVLRVSIALLVVLASPAAAQLESPLLSKVYPNIVNPGGKSLAMGGAFVALADDATAAFANPAGLADFSRWEIGASGKAFAFEPKLTTANYLENPQGTFTRTSVDEYEPTGKATELEYFSVVIPVVDKLTLSAYRAVNLRYRLDASDLVGGNYRVFWVNRGGTSSTSIDEQGGLDIRNELYGLSAGFRLGSRVAIGGGVTLNNLRFDLTGGSAGGSHVFIANADNGNQTSVPDPRIDATVSADVDGGTKLGWVVGARFDVSDAPRVQIGISYRHSPTFDVGYSISATGAVIPPTSFACGDGTATGESACGTFQVPDDVSVGVAILPAKGLTIALEAQRVMYSQLNDGFVPIFAYSGCTAGAPASCPVSSRTRSISEGTSEDGTIPRVGAEYTAEFRSGQQVSFRAGWYREPAHGTEIDLYPDADRDRRPDGATPVEIVNPPLSDAFRTSYDGGEAQNHYSFGAGATFGKAFSLDLAFDIGKTTRQFVLSAFVRL
jgi:long-subunit fatty acid transport protein